uniref:Glycoside hydrolase family 5 domain-containing protein n=1 Tax=Graphocephala atropunctata TaxID=36148 RepID=A0A1B6KME0_9HEMI
MALRIAVLYSSLITFLLVSSKVTKNRKTLQRAITAGKHFRGVNRSGAEFKCVQNGFGVFDGPVDNASIAAMKTWNINIVRVPLNEDCWLGIHNHNPAFSGANYRRAVIAFVNRLRENNLTVILDLHWTDGLYSGPGQGSCYDEAAKCQKPMPDKKNSPKFWQWVAKQFMDDEGIIFDLFNEPFPDRAMNSTGTAAWQCWRNGGDACSGFQYEVAGMQDLLDAVRGVGARNLVMVGGLAWSNDLSQWMTYVPTDAANNIAASWHSYNFNYCNNTACWESEIAPIAARYPVIVGETGENDCDHTYVDELMNWLDSKYISYLGWTWNTWDCFSGPSLIMDYDGSPTAYGIGLKEHLQKQIKD